jgi:zinc/manganese transport system substrate-binding protein
MLGCQNRGGTATEQAKAGATLPVVASFSILGDWVQAIGGPRVAVTTLVGPDEDAHVYLPRPADAVAIQRAAAVFEMGLGFETWMESLFVGTGSAARRVVVTEALTPDLILSADGAEVVSSQANGPAEPDPHVWHSPALVKRMVQRIAAELTELDPAGASDYRQRAEEYLSALDALDREIRNQVATIPVARRHLVTTHDTFAYFARDYGFQVSNLLGSVSSEVADPSAAQMATLVERIRHHQVPAVFSENILDEKLTQQVAREAGVQVVSALRTDALGPAGTDGETYLDLMRGNLQIMAESLQ